jgi:hypothetical protein
MLPCPMFSSHSSQSHSSSRGSSSCELSASPFNSCALLPFDISTFEPCNLQTILFVILFPAALTGHPELNENKTTLSLAFVTLTSLVTYNPFACHSCKKHRGVGIPGECLSDRSEGSAFSHSLSPLPRQSHPTKGNPSIVSALSLPPVMSHQSPGQLPLGAPSMTFLLSTSQSCPNMNRGGPMLAALWPSCLKSEIFTFRIAHARGTCVRR